MAALEGENTQRVEGLLPASLRPSTPREPRSAGVQRMPDWWGCRSGRLSLPNCKRKYLVFFKSGSSQVLGCSEDEWTNSSLNVEARPFTVRVPVGGWHSAAAWGKPLNTLRNNDFPLCVICLCYMLKFLQGN